LKTEDSGGSSEYAYERIDGRNSGVRYRRSASETCDMLMLLRGRIVEERNLLT